MPNTLIAHLYLEGISLRDSGVELLCTGLYRNDRVLEVDLTYNSITKVGMKSLKLVLIEPHNSIMKLKVSRNPIGEGVKQLARALLESDCQVRHLFIN